MKSKDKKQLAGKSIAELAAEYTKAREELANLMLDNMQGKLKNTSSLSTKRRDIAIMKTKMREKQLLGETL